MRMETAEADGFMTVAARRQSPARRRLRGVPTRYLPDALYREATSYGQEGVQGSTQGVALAWATSVQGQYNSVAPFPRGH